MDFKNLDELIVQALKEDEIANDITTDLLIRRDQISRGYIVFKENAVVCGLKIAKQILQKLDKNIQFRFLYKDGDYVRMNSKVAMITGNTRSILKGERTVLNFLMHLSGIASLTRQFVKKVGNSKVKILDTRKTLPGLRRLEKYAVRCGGGTNHRMNLEDMVLIKDNHIAAIGAHLPLAQIIQRVRRRINKPIEVEVENYTQFLEASRAHPNIILLDNMKIAAIRKMVRFHKRHILHKNIQLEASGGVTLKTVLKLAKTGVDRISIGALTHSAKAIDISLEIVSKKGRKI